MDFETRTINVSLEEAGDGNRTCATPTKCGYSQGNNEDASDVTMTFFTNTLRPDGRVCTILSGETKCDLSVACDGGDDDVLADKCTFNFTQNEPGDQFIPFKMNVSGVQQVEESNLKLSYKPIPRMIAVPIHEGTKIAEQTYTGISVDVGEHFC